ncbi:hypothetical protein H1D32_05740 [Anaerobacillus sp. CMMVII]|uniref:hypothetical protein n=1 Tax=Anaerobacillus sp. CMMVII TaxID=2755588 RepID=UPI0021B84A29|nr:hypothetical protein [Anaerobacillus sp. CMMVII]MCT8137289.1 hypothetical protein [Anaerobacillus sp. CMMVII]
MKYILLFFLVTGMIFSQMDFAYAHKMVIETVEAGKIRVVYEDGSFSRRTIVILYDANGNELSRGSLDHEGYFFYDPKKVSLVVANDGIGHRAEWEVGTINQKKSHPIDGL